MTNTTPREAVETIIDVLIGAHGSLGYTDFRIYSIKPNHLENVYIVKYSFIPRDSERKKIFHETKVNIIDKNIFETKEIKETDL